MTVDLLRNDLSIIADRVTVKKFRYPIIAKAGNKELIQIVSEIVGDLRDGYKKKLGDILFSLLPAGSITGTPKKKCLEVLEQIEGFERGYFCGVFGIFDGEELQSAVSIRFIEKTENGYIYKSGGGITLDSDWEREYDEMVEKVYIAL
jgi:para-aminobenzoate synthetase component 1